MMDISAFTDRINFIIGAIVAVLSYVFGEHWIIFSAFLAFNVGDFLTRWMASYINGDESSKRCLVGIVKKLGYWVMIALGFGMGVIFIEIGEVIHVDLQITSLIGWFVLATLMINEIRSILENLIEAHFPIPRALVKGLEIAQNTLDDLEEGFKDEPEEIDDEEE